MTYLIPLFEFLTALLATIFYKKYKSSTEKHFMPFLWFTFFIDFIVGGFVGIVLEQNNNWVYILFTVISFLFYFYWFYRILLKKRHKQLLLIMILIFIVIAFYNFITQSWLEYQTTTFTVGAILNLLASLLFFSQLLTSKNIIEIKYKLSFWIATGLLLFNIGMVPLIFFSEYFNSNNQLYMIILVALNAILYSCYSLGFLWNKKEYNQHL